jgi:uncharacterized membrane protein HdeD (DUF308 family)
MPERAQQWVHHAKRNATLLIIFGILVVIFGVLSIASPMMTGVAVAMFVGALMLVTGIMRIIAAIKSGQWGSGIFGTLIGLLGVAAGIILLAQPMLGLATLTLLLAAYFLADGICEIIVSFKMKPEKGWGWMLFGGIISVLLGFMIWRQWPVSGAWAIGVLVGVHILMVGFTMIFIGSGARGIAGSIEDAAEDVYDRAKELAGDVAKKADERID